MNDDLISRESVLKLIEDIKNDPNVPKNYGTLLDILREVRKIPTVHDMDKVEEQGKILRLPCSVGDEVYKLNPLRNGEFIIVETSADAFFCSLCVLEDRFGKTVFTSREQAEVALKELEREKWLNL